MTRKVIVPCYRRAQNARMGGLFLFWIAVLGGIGFAVHHGKGEALYAASILILAVVLLVPAFWRLLS